MKRVHYVAPQVWAWRERRVRHYHGLWDQLLCLLPFEPSFFAGHGLPATFVGHPVLESGADHGDAARFRAIHGIDPSTRVLTLMPGIGFIISAGITWVLASRLGLMPPPASTSHSLDTRLER